MRREDRDVAQEIEAIFDWRRRRGRTERQIPRASMAFLATRWPSQSGRRKESERSRAATSWWLLAASPTPPISVSTRPAWNWMRRGFVRVNERLQTTAPGIWAIGECAGSPQFTHISVDDFRISRGEYVRRQSQDRRSPSTLCCVHRSAVGARRPLRGRSAASRCPGAGRPGYR